MMASSHEDAPVCPECNRSQGIQTEASVGLIWSRGDWIMMTDPVDVPDLTCPCGHQWSGHLL
jgi:hypothetical protein